MFIGEVNKGARAVYLHKPATMHPALRRYADLYLRWHTRLAEHLAMQRHPAWWC